LGSDGIEIRDSGGGGRLGYSLSAAGDVNGDGLDDFIVGAPYNSADGDRAGRAFVIYGHAGAGADIDLAALPPSDGFMIRGDTAYDKAGTDVAAVGDVNGDGFGDVIVAADLGAPGFINHVSDPIAYVIFGKAGGAAVDLSSLTPSSGFAIRGKALFGYGTFRVATAGDVNGDGFDDFILGSRYGSQGENASYVIFGKASGWGDINLADLPASAGFIIHGSADYSTPRVSSAGDVNGDGFDDILVGAPYAGGSGQAYVIFGKAGGFAPIALASLSMPTGFKIQGDPAHAGAGFDVSCAGDVNGDGFDDIIISERGYDPFGSSTATAYVVFGKASGFGSIDLANLGPSNGFVIQGPSHYAVGFSVSNAGDVNGDGFDDFIIGTRIAVYSHLGTSGEAYVIFGKAAGLGTIDLAHLGPADGLIIDGKAGDEAGFSVSGAGDVNGDGFADVLVGAPFAGGGGEAYLLWGRASFSVRDLASGGIGDFNGDGRDDILWRNDSGRVTDWLGQAGSGGFVSNFANADASAGLDWHVAGTGDFNGDGITDVLWRNDNGDMTDWLGQANGNFASNFGNAYYQLAGSWHVAGIGDFNGDGHEDILLRNDSGRVTDWLGQANGTGGFSGNFANADANAGLDWHIVGTGDFNGDGLSDVLWRNDNGDVTDWLGQAGGGFASNFGNAFYQVDNSWRVAGTSDFNGDGITDILWRSDSGRVTDWLGQSNGTGGFTSNFANADLSAGIDWHIVGTGDFNGDSIDDVLWRKDDGDVTDWLGQANGNFVSNFGNAFYEVDNGWHVRDPLIALL
jgi:hypothetical protein